MSKVVFVGNVPYHMGEEQLIEAFKSVGQVVGFRLVYDRDTGKPKGYGFCEFADHDTAMSAVRNLNNQEVGGRPLRIDLADSDPFLEGKTTVRGELVDSQETRAQWREREREREHGGPKSRDSRSFLSDLPPGVPVPPGKTAGDLITEVLATTPPAQIFEVLAQMKASRAFVITHPEQAKALLVAHPQLGYAMFQALLVNKIVDTAVLERMLAATTGAAPPPPSAAAPPYHQPPLQHPQPGFNQPPQGMGMPPPHLAGPHHPTPPLPGAPGSMYGAPPGPSQAHMPPPQYYRPPVPAPAPVPTPPVPAPAPVAAATPAPAGTQSLDPSARDMLMQVLNLTSEQVASLPAPERDQINQLRKQFNMPPLS